MRPILIFIITAISFNSYGATTPKSIECLSAREYITTYRFLAKNKAFGLKEKMIQKFSDQVSLGCSGASQRFIKVVKLLTNMGIDSNTSVKKALHFSGKDERFTDVFVQVFKQTYDPKLLDLDVLNAMKISLKLSAQFKGNPKIALKDFKKLVAFCLENKSMDMAIPKCAFLAMDIASLSENFDKSAAKPFIKLMNFIQSDSKGPKLPRNKALKIAKGIIKFGPTSYENFRNGYIFAIGKKGLNLNLNDAISFANKMAQRSTQIESKLKSKQ